MTGKTSRFERYDVASVIDPNKLPEWAKEKLQILQNSKEKPSVLTQVKTNKDTVIKHEGKRLGKSNNQER